MSERRSRRRWAAVRYPLKPEKLLRFIELKPFTDSWRNLRLDDDDLLALQLLIMLNPTGSPVVEKTGGLRKLRFAPARWHTGKSGAARIGYVYLQEYGTVLLVIAYTKNDKDDLTPGEKQAIRRLIQRIENEFESGMIR